MNNYQDGLDWDYYEYGAKEYEEQQKMKGVKKFDQNTVYLKKDIDNEKYFNHFNIFQNNEELHDTYGVYVKDTTFSKCAGNLKITDKKEYPVDQTLLDNCQTPKNLQNNLLSSDQDKRIKSGTIVSTFPNTAFGIVVVTFKNNVKFRGTGTMVNVNHVLISANMLLTQSNQKMDEIQSIEFILGAVNNYSLYKKANVIKAVVLNKEFPIKPENDFAVLMLDQPLGLFSGFYGLCAMPEQTLKQQKIQLTGYPFETSNDNKQICQHSDTGIIDQIKDGQLVYQIEAAEGQNGSPLYSVKQISDYQSLYFIHGIHQGNLSKNQDNHHPNHNYGSALTKQNCEQLMQIIQFHFIESGLDEQLFNIIFQNQQTIIADLQDCNTTNKISADLMFSLRSELSIRDLSLSIKNREGKACVSDEGIRELSESFKQIRHIKTLKLDIYGCEQLTDESLKHLGQGLGSLKDLENLLLSINQNSKFSNQGISALFSELQGLQMCNNFSLLLSNIKGISDQSGVFIGSNISLMKGLRELKIDLTLIKKMTEKGVKDMTNIISNHRALDKVTYSFMGMNLKPQVKKDIKVKYGYCPHFTIA